MKINTKKYLPGLLKVKPRYAKKLVDKGADPWVIFHEGFFYYCRVHDDWQISVAKSKTLAGISKKPKIVWSHALGNASAMVWAPELHFVEGHWYIYFTMGAGADHRMYVLRATTADPQGDYEFKGKITDPTDKWAIDGTVLQLRGRLYFVWSGWEGDEDVQQNLYIAPMSNPWTISGERTLIASPTLPWEKSSREGLCQVNEGPQILEHEDKVYIVYSASHSLTDDYCLGLLTLTGSNPLDSHAWKKSPTPLFAKTNDVFGPGHASFVTTKNGDDWIIYHSARSSGGGWDRQVMAQRFEWDQAGLPVLGQPLPHRRPLNFARIIRKRAKPVSLTRQP